MKRVHNFLKLFIFAQLGTCVGRVLWLYCDYVKYPDLYEMVGDPWYYRARQYVIITAILVAVTATAYFILGGVIKRKGAEGEKKE